MSEEGVHVGYDDRCVAVGHSVPAKDMILWVTVHGPLWHFSWNAYQPLTDHDIDVLKKMLIDACDREKARRIAERQ